MSEMDLVLKTKIEIFKAVMALDAKAPIFVELAEALVETGQADEAVEICRQGLEHHPDMLAGWVGLMEALLADGRPDEAKEALSRAKRQAAAASQSLERLSLLEHRLVGEKPATPPPEASLPGLEEEPDGEYPAEPIQFDSQTLGDLYLRQGQKQAATRVYERLLAKDPGNKAIRARLISLRRQAAAEHHGGAVPASGQRLLTILEKWRALFRARAARMPA